MIERKDTKHPCDAEKRKKNDGTFYAKSIKEHKRQLSSALHSSCSSLSRRLLPFFDLNTLVTQIFQFQPKHPLRGVMSIHTLDKLRLKTRRNSKANTCTVSTRVNWSYRLLCQFSYTSLTQLTQVLHNLKVVPYAILF